MLKSPSILEKFNVKPLENASCVCYCVFNQREMCVLIEICITSSSIISINLLTLHVPCYEAFLVT